MLLAPIAASLIQMAISRAREFEADRGGAEISGDPQALASALQKIHHYARGIPLETAERHPETAQMMIMNPLSGGGAQGKDDEGGTHGGRWSVRSLIGPLPPDLSATAGAATRSRCT